VARVVHESRVAGADLTGVVRDGAGVGGGHERRKAVAVVLGDALVHIAIRGAAALHEKNAEVFREDGA
jgi:hypothetical protein